MTLHVLVEGPSEVALLERWGARLFPGEWRIHPHQGKGRLPGRGRLGKPPSPTGRGVLDQLPAKLRAFSQSLTALDGILVLVDADDEDAADLRAAIDEVAKKVAPRLRVAVSVAVEETEAFYLGDLAALKRAFPEADHDKARAYVPDAVCGTWELFGEIVGDGGGNKVAWAEAMGSVLTTRPARSRSPSFRLLIEAVLRLEPPHPAKPRKKAYRHPPRSKKTPSRRR